MSGTKQGECKRCKCGPHVAALSRSLLSCIPFASVQTLAPGVDDSRLPLLSHGKRVCVCVRIAFSDFTLMCSIIQIPLSLVKNLSTVHRRWTELFECQGSLGLFSPATIARLASAGPESLLLYFIARTLINAYYIRNIKNVIKIRIVSAQ